MNNFKTPSRAMAATITLVLLALYAISYLAPALQVSWIRADAKFDAGLQQTLLLMLTLSIGYYIGSSKGSADANDAMRAQVAATIPPAQPPAAPILPAPLAPTPSGPVEVTVANTAPVPVVVEDEWSKHVDAQVGDLVTISGKTFRLMALPASTLDNWKEVPADPIAPSAAATAPRNPF